MTIERIVKKAHELEIDQIIITDHHENVKDQFLSKFHIFDVEKHIQALHSFGLPAGVEFGWDTETAIEFPIEKYEFVILCFHDLHTAGDDTKINYERYLQDVWKGVNTFTQYTVLGHLDLPRRYIAGNIPFTKIDFPYFEAIFRKIIPLGKGIELNCSAISSYGEPNPASDIVELYYQCGGRVITLGSDAHEIEKIGQNLFRGIEILKSIGFKYLSVYENGELGFKPF